MTSLADVMRAMAVWTPPPGGDNPFTLSCRVGSGATAEEIVQAAGSSSLPDEVKELWTASRESWLFEDAEYGQWGVHLLAPTDSHNRSAVARADRPSEYRSDDIVIGEFLGDSDLLIYAPSETSNRRCLVALPMDSRGDWYPVGSSLPDVLLRLLEADGNKYWE